MLAVAQDRNGCWRTAESEIQHAMENEAEDFGSAQGEDEDMEDARSDYSDDSRSSEASSRSSRSAASTGTTASASSMAPGITRRTRRRRVPMAVESAQLPIIFE